MTNSISISGPETQIPVPGVVRTSAVLLHAGGQVLAFERRSAAGEQIFWEKRVPAGAAKLTAPGPVGLIVLVIRGVTVHNLLAFEVKGSRVVSAISGVSSGKVQADESIVTSSSGFELKSHDLAHVGSVKYRNVLHYRWEVSRYVLHRETKAPDYAPTDLPRPSASIHVNGSTALLRLEVADTEQLRQTGLMNRKTLDPDAGMIFVWQQDVHESFWMENTDVSLTVAFVGADGIIHELQDMDPLTTSLHTPVQPYRFAIEANQGYFTAHHVHSGDAVDLLLR